MISLTRKLSVNLPQNALLTICKSFIRPHCNWVIYDKPNNENIQNKIEKVQYQACLTITGAIPGASREKIYDELGFQFLAKRRWRSNLYFFIK